MSSLHRGFWRHRQALDCDILVLKVQYQSQKYKKLKIEWFIRGRSLGIKQNVTITSEHWKDWLPV